MCTSCDYQHLIHGDHSAHPLLLHVATPFQYSTRHIAKALGSQDAFWHWGGLWWSNFSNQAYSYFSIWLANFSKLLWPFATADNKINSATANWASVTSPTMLSLPYNHLMILQCDHHPLCSQDYGAFYSCGSPSNMTLRIITSRTTSQGIIQRSTWFVDSTHGPSRAKSWLVTTNLD
jgi:hypothetical protein